MFVTPVRAKVLMKNITKLISLQTQEKSIIVGSGKIDTISVNLIDWVGGFAQYNFLMNIRE